MFPMQQKTQENGDTVTSPRVAEPRMKPPEVVSLEKNREATLTRYARRLANL